MIRLRLPRFNTVRPNAARANTARRGSLSLTPTCFALTCFALPSAIGTGACGHIGVDLTQPDGDASLALGPDADRPDEPSDKPDASARPSTQNPSPVGDASFASDAAIMTVPDSGEGSGAEGGMLTDGGTRPSRDASANGNTRDAAPPTLNLDGGTEAPDDAGIDPKVCEPNCECAVGVCEDLVCEVDGCLVACAAETRCAVEVDESEEVNLGCGAGAVCEARADQVDQVNFICEGPGECFAGCGDAQDCTMECFGSTKCTLDCEDAASCAITRCEPTTDCFLFHPNPETETDLECVGDAPVSECGDTLQTCHIPCPPITP